MFVLSNHLGDLIPRYSTRILGCIKPGPGIPHIPATARPSISENFKPACFKASSAQYF